MRNFDSRPLARARCRHAPQFRASSAPRVDVCASRHRGNGWQRTEARTEEMTAGLAETHRFLNVGGSGIPWRAPQSTAVGAPAYYGPKHDVVARSRGPALRPTPAVE